MRYKRCEPKTLAWKIDIQMQSGAEMANGRNAGQGRALLARTAALRQQMVLVIQHVAVAVPVHCRNSGDQRASLQKPLRSQKLRTPALVFIQQIRQRDAAQ